MLKEQPHVPAAGTRLMTPKTARGGGGEGFGLQLSVEAQHTDFLPEVLFSSIVVSLPSTPISRKEEGLTIPPVGFLKKV